MKHKDYKSSAPAVNTTYCWNITRKGNLKKKILKIIYNPLLFQPACSLKLLKMWILILCKLLLICNLKAIIIIWIGELYFSSSLPKSKLGFIDRRRAYIVFVLGEIRTNFLKSSYNCFILVCIHYTVLNSRF